MNLHNLRIFLKVAELEHITRASEELHLSQPAVTKIIQSLEHETGLELVERRGGGSRSLMLAVYSKTMHARYFPLSVKWKMLSLPCMISKGERLL